MKCCSTCHENKEYVDFYKTKDGKYKASCKQCSRIDSRIRGKLYYKNNKESKNILEKCEIYRKNNLAKISERDKKYYKNNKEAIKKKSLEYFHNNREDILIKKKEYRVKNNEKIKIKSKIRYNRVKKDFLIECKKYRDANKDKIREYKKAYYKTDNGRLISAIAKRKRRARLKKCQNDNHDIEVEKRMDEDRILLENSTGIKHQIDHIFPISFGGPHWHLNLQILPKTINSEKLIKLDYFHPLYKHWTDMPQEVLNAINPDSMAYAEKQISLIEFFNLRRSHVTAS